MKDHMMPFDTIRQLLATELTAVEQRLTHPQQSNIPMVNQLILHLTANGGKRLRPILLILIAKSLGYTGDQHIELGTAMEFIHTATLLHDDVVDASHLRRGQQTANDIWGNELSVLVGDFLYSQALSSLTQTNNMLILSTVSTTVAQIAEGEVLQLMNRRNLALSFDDYFNIIQRKTGLLFEMTAHLGAILGSRDPLLQTAARNYGMALGIAFQLVDDVLDYSGDASTIGKNIGDDLHDGNLTLPLLHVLQNGNPDEIQWIRTAILRKPKENAKCSGGEIDEMIDTKMIDNIIASFHRTGAIKYTLQLAENYVASALEAITNFPQTIYTEALTDLAKFAIARDH